MRISELICQGQSRWGVSRMSKLLVIPLPLHRIRSKRKHCDFKFLHRLLMINTFKKHGLQPGCDRSPVRLVLVGQVSWPEVHRGVREELRGFRGWRPWSQRSGGVACGGRSQRDKELLGEPGPWRDPVVTCFVGFKSLSHGHSWIEWFGGTYILGTICRLSMIDSRMGWSWWSWDDAHPSGQGGKVDRFSHGILAAEFIFPENPWGNIWIYLVYGLHLFRGSRNL